MNTKNCKVCQKEFTDYPSNIEKRIFCSHICQNKFYKTGAKVSDETKAKMSLAHKGKHRAGEPASWKHTLEQDKRHSELMKGRFIGALNPMYKHGLPNCRECGKQLVNYNNKLCINCLHIPRNNGNWKGGITKSSFQIRACKLYKEWRKFCMERDKFQCQGCGDKQGGNLCVDHIKPFALIIKQNSIDSLEKAMQCEELWNINNGRTLCLDCHKKTDTYLEKTSMLIKSLSL